MDYDHLDGDHNSGRMYLNGVPASMPLKNIITHAIYRKNICVASPAFKNVFHSIQQEEAKTRVDLVKNDKMELKNC
jgi:hypothetical protein